jgi:D-alanyl-D-alanine carboxypeptidase/D-alanyl-D-alanine-endopeptidase (penicillin-binding protein 4)
MWIEEGSGLSRRNKMSVTQMIKVLNAFRPYRLLLNREGRVLIKTGSLKGVRSLAGYLLPDRDLPLVFTIILNGAEARTGRREKILELLEQGLVKTP